MKWNELKKGDKLFLCVPTYNDEGIFNGYCYQESEVINNKKYKGYSACNLAFKYSFNGDGKRIKIQRTVYGAEFENPFIFSDGYYVSSMENNVGVGMIVISCNSKEDVINGLKEILKKFDTHIQQSKKAYKQISSLIDEK